MPGLSELSLRVRRVLVRTSAVFAAMRQISPQLAPLDRHVGDAPAMSDADIKDNVAFLNTLTDGYDP
jgi:hypothetical protein